MSEPIAPTDTAALANIAENAIAYGMDRGFTSRALAENIATAVARAVCPETHVVVSRDDLRKAVSTMILMGQDGEACDRLIRVLNGEPAF